MAHRALACAALPRLLDRSCFGGLPSWALAKRHISEEQLNACPERVAELLQSLQQAPQKKTDTPLRLLTTRREALSLYRSIWRWSALFVWKDERGRPWKDVLRQSARKEFEDARFEQDPQLINRLIITGRDCVQRTLDTFLKKRQALLDQEASSSGGPPGKPTL